MISCDYKIESDDEEYLAYVKAFADSSDDDDDSSDEEADDESEQEENVESHYLTPHPNRQVINANGEDFNNSSFEDKKSKILEEIQDLFSNNERQNNGCASIYEFVEMLSYQNGFGDMFEERVNGGNNDIILDLTELDTQPNDSVSTDQNESSDWGEDDNISNDVEDFINDSMEEGEGDHKDDLVENQQTFQNYNLGYKSTIFNAINFNNWLAKGAIILGIILFLIQNVTSAVTPSQNTWWKYIQAGHIFTEYKIQPLFTKVVMKKTVELHILDVIEAGEAGIDTLVHAIPSKNFCNKYKDIPTCEVDKNRKVVSIKLAIAKWVNNFKLLKPICANPPYNKAQEEFNTTRRKSQEKRALGILIAILVGAIGALAVGSLWSSSITKHEVENFQASQTKVDRLTSKAGHLFNLEDKKLANAINYGNDLEFIQDLTFQQVAMATDCRQNN